MIRNSGSSALSPKEKAAVLLVSLGNEYSTELYKHFSSDEIDEITKSAAAAGRLTTKERERIVKEFYELCLARKLIKDGGINYARDILSETLGRAKAETLLYWQPATLQDVPLECAQKSPDDYNIGLPVKAAASESDLFVFEDIAKLSSSSIRRALREISYTDLAIALKLSAENVSKAVFSNVTRQVQDTIKNEMEHMGPVRVQDAQDAYRRIVNTIRNLEDEGEIEIVRCLQVASIA